MTNKKLDNVIKLKNFKPPVEEDGGLPYISADIINNIKNPLGLAVWTLCCYLERQEIFPTRRKLILIIRDNFQVSREAAIEAIRYLESHIAIIFDTYEDNELDQPLSQAFNFIWSP